MDKLETPSCLGLLYRIQRKALFFSIVFLVAIISSYTQQTYSQSNSLQGKTIRFCAGSHEWPPYYFYKRIANVKTNIITGIDIEIFDRILGREGILYTAELLPWSRCLKLGKEGKHYDVVFGGGLNDQRRADYLTTMGYYTVVPSYCYSKNEFPNGLNVTSGEVLHEFGNLCGIRGFNYVNFGTTNDRVEMGAPNYEILVKKTQRQRCNVSLVRRQILAGWGMILNIPFLNLPDLEFKPIPNNDKETFHLMISTNFSGGEEFKKIFEEGIERLNDSGEMKNIFKKYFLEY